MFTNPIRPGATRTTTPGLTPIALGCIVALVAGARAQDSICSYTWNSNVACDAYIPCVSAAEFSGRTFVVPANVTRISRNGLHVCLSDTAFNNPADIVYVVDMSGSMLPCYSDPGDPYFKRADAVRAGYEYQRDSVPGSRFGYVGFAGTLVTRDNWGDDERQYINTWRDCYYGSNEARLRSDHLLPPVVLDAAGQTRAEQAIANLYHDQHLRDASGTNYYVSLRRALYWLTDPVLSPNPNKAIVFVTDGRPTRDETLHDRIVDSLIDEGIPVFGIHLGTTDNTTLAAISRATGGAYYVVPPSNTDTLATVVRGIVREINNYLFDALTVSANGVTANGIDAVKNADAGTWDITLDAIVPLMPGPNTVVFYSRFDIGESGNSKELSFSFTIDVSGPPDQACVSCRPVTTVNILSPSTGAPLDSLTFQDSAYLLQLRYYGEDQLSAVNVAVQTGKGDYEVVHMSSPAIGPNGELVFERVVPFVIVDETVAAGPNNGITQAAVIDTLAAGWAHPHDPRDTASCRVPVVSPPDQLAVYDAPGDPSGLSPYAVPPAVDTVIAGTAAPLYAKVFNHGVWLSSYETEPVLAAGIRWHMVLVSGPGGGPAGTLDTAVGAHITFMPLRAYTLVDITASMFNGVDSIRTTVRLAIKPGAPRMLSIESSPDRDFSPNALPTPPLDTVTIGSNVTVARPVYAVLRDSLGNYVRPATEARWASLAVDIATAASGDRSLGEGVITRGGAGAALVEAVEGGLSDRIVVVVKACYYTRLVVTRGDIADSLDSLVITTESDTIALFAWGLRSDNGTWEPVGEAAWDITAPALVTPGAPAGSARWPFVPTGIGTARVSAATEGTPGIVMDDSVVLIVVHGPPRALVIYPDTGDPSGQAPVPPRISVTAGDTVPLIAKLFNNFNQWIAQGERADSLRRRISWSLAPATASEAHIDSTAGHRTRFSATAAHQTCVVKAVYTHDDVTLIDSVIIDVEPAPPAQLTIEPGSNWQDFPAEPQRFPNDTITITSEESGAVVYAILRDRFGNFVAFSTATVWRSAQNTIVTAASGPRTMLGEGILTRVAASGVTVITATDGPLSGSAPVHVLQYYYRELQIFVKNPVFRLDSLIMNTNLDTMLYVMGRRSNDPFTWDTIAAQWEVAPSLEGNIAGAAHSPSLPISPVASGGGWVRVTLGNDDRTLPDTVGLVFTRGPATSVSISIVTPPDDRIAGEPLTAKVEIFNQDGPVPGDTCVVSVFGDLLGPGTPAFPSTVTAGDSTVELGDSVRVCFTGGVTTVSFVLYYAPPDRKHALLVGLGETPLLSDTTEPFILAPGPLARLEIVDIDSVPIDSVLLHAPDDWRVFFTLGYDAWGNPRGYEAADWSVSDNPDAQLHPIAQSDSVWRVFYESAPARGTERGWIRAVGPGDTAVRDSARVHIVGPLAGLSYAVTRDTNANGYLDGMMLHFDEPVTLPSSELELAILLDNISFVYEGTSFEAVAIVGVNGTLTDSAFFVTLVEQRTDEPQTAWTPSVAWVDVPGVMDLAPTTAQDGAGPVIWRIVKYVADGAVPRVEVTLSERVQDSSGGSLLGTGRDIPVEELFHVYYRVPGTEQYLSRDSLLSGIVLLDAIGDSTLVFEMTNGNDLVSGYYMNLRTCIDSSDGAVDTLCIIADRSLTGTGPNAPLPDNRKVVVEQVGELRLRMTPVPNPSRPGEQFEIAGELTAGHSEAVRYAIETRSLHGGNAAKVDLPVPAGGEVRVQRSIYDMVGNLVHSARIDDLLSSYCDETGARRDQLPSMVYVYFYWNGFNDDGLPVAPGVYREITLFSFTDGYEMDVRVMTMYGIVR